MKITSHCEEAVRPNTGNLLQQVIKTSSKWLSTGFGSRFLNYIDGTAELPEQLQALRLRIASVHPRPPETM